MPQGETPSDQKPVLKLGSYMLLEPLGSGGMSSVFKAVHEEQGLEVAVKVLPKYLAKNPVLLQRFLREAQSAEALEHPSIVSIYDRGVADGRHYLVLEYVPGGDLHDHVRKNGPMPLAGAVDAIIESAEALRYAASRGLIHRDIKPANILREPSGRIKLIDLGLALQFEAEDERVTRDGTTVGTVDYMSPEQARDSRAANVPSDIYSLGCTFHYLLTGQPPFPGGDIADKLRRHAQAPPPDLVKLRPDAPPTLARVLARMLSKTAARRYPDYEALLADLRSIPGHDLEDDSGAAYALVDDDDEGDDDEGPFALVDDEEPGGSADFRLGGGGDSTSPSPPSTAAALSPIGGPPSLPGTRRPPSSGDEEDVVPSSPFRLAELAGLVEDDSDPTLRIARPRPGPAPVLQPPAPPPDDHEAGDEDEEDEEDFQEAELDLEGDGPSRRLIVAGALGGLLLLLVGLGLFRLVSEDRGGGGGAAPVVEAIDPGPSGPAPAIAVMNNDLSKPKGPEPSTPEPDRSAANPIPVVLPPAPPPLAPEITIPEGMAESLGAAIPGLALDEEGMKVERVRRLGGMSLRRALEQSDAAIEVEDLGPFFENDLRVRGQRRVIRAPEGKRAILVLRASGALEREPAPIPVRESLLLLERIDLVVPGDALAPGQLFVFFCGKDARVVMRDCTVTLLPRGSRPIGLARIGEEGRLGRPALVLERTFVRGGAGTLIQAEPSSFLIDLRESVLLTRDGPVLSLPGQAETGLVSFWRTLAASNSTAISVARSFGSSDRPGTVQVRALASWIGRIAGGTASPLLEVDPQSGLVDWKGYGNQYRGWSALAANGSGRPVEAPRDSPFPAFWSEQESIVADGQGVALESPLSKVMLADLESRVPEFAATLARVQPPAPDLLARTIDRFEPFADEQPWPAPAGAVVRFDPSDSGYKGDFGALVRKLAQGFAEPTGWIRVEIAGAAPDGPLTMTPIRLRPGLSLEVRVAEPLRGKVSWRARPELAAETLVAVPEGDLLLAGVRMELSAEARVRRAIVVSSGRLRIERSWLGSLHGEVLEEPPLIEATAPAGESGEWISLADTLLVGPGAGLRARAGGGRIALRNSAIATVGPALDLIGTGSDSSAPAVIRGLLLDRCTLASETSLVSISGTGRPPWVVQSRSTHFLDDYANRLRTTPVLTVDPAMLAEGGVVWQGEKDGLEVGRFVAAPGEAPAEGRQADYRSAWVGFWGPAHVSVAFGPRIGEGGTDFPRKVGRLIPGAPSRQTLFPDGWSPGWVGGVGASPGRFLPGP